MKKVIGKMMIMLLSGVQFSSLALAGDTDSSLEFLNQSTTGDAKQGTQSKKLSTIDQIHFNLTEDMKLKCVKDVGCELITDTCGGIETKVTVGAGEGQNIGNGGNGGINIFNSSTSGQYYGITFAIGYSNYKVTRIVPEATYKAINVYLELFASKEYANMVLAALKNGEDLKTPDAVLTAMSLLSTLKPTQSNCGTIRN